MIDLAFPVQDARLADCSDPVFANVEIAHCAGPQRKGPRQITVLPVVDPDLQFRPGISHGGRGTGLLASNLNGFRSGNGRLGGVDLARHRALTRRLDLAVAIHDGEIVAALGQRYTAVCQREHRDEFFGRVRGAICGSCRRHVRPNRLVTASNMTGWRCQQREPFRQVGLNRCCGCKASRICAQRWQPPMARRPIAEPKNIGSEVCFHRDSGSPRELPQPDCRPLLR